MLYEFKVAGKETLTDTAGNTESSRSKAWRQGRGDEAGSSHVSEHSRCGSSESDQWLWLFALLTSG